MKKSMSFALSILLGASLLSPLVHAYPGMKPQGEQAGSANTMSSNQVDVTALKIQRLAEPFNLTNIIFQDQQGQPIDLAYFKGKVTMINMWATWCPPCIRELPALDTLAKRFPEKDFALVPVSIDQEGKQIVDPFLANLKLKNFTSYFDPTQRLGEIFPLDYIPATFILNREGQLVAFVRSYVDWAEPEAIALLEELIQAPAATAKIMQ